MELIEATNGAPTSRADLHISRSRDGELFIPSRQDGMGWMLVPDSGGKTALSRYESARPGASDQRLVGHHLPQLHEEVLDEDVALDISMGYAWGPIRGLPAYRVRRFDHAPELRQRALEVALAGNHLAPLFNPPTHVGNEQGAGPARLCGGGGGGTNITGPAVADPVAGVMFVSSTSNCSYEFLMLGIESPMDGPEMTGKILTQWVRGADGGMRAPEDIDGLSIWKGSVGRITAIDMNTGEHLWVLPNGYAPQAEQDAIANHPLLQGIPDVDINRGRASNAAMVATPTLLLYGGRDADDTWNLFAIDKATGTQVGAVEIPGMTRYGMSSWVHEGKQYVIIQLQDGLAAMALP